MVNDKDKSDFSGKNKREVSDGMRHGSSECGKKMREWREEKEKKK